MLFRRPIDVLVFEQKKAHRPLCVNAIPARQQATSATKPPVCLSACLSVCLSIRLPVFYQPHRDAQRRASVDDDQRTVVIRRGPRCTICCELLGQWVLGCCPYKQGCQIRRHRRWPTRRWSRVRRTDRRPAGSVTLKVASCDSPAAGGPRNDAATCRELAQTPSVTAATAVVPPPPPLLLLLLDSAQRQ